jgi:hypothetical protein
MDNDDDGLDAQTIALLGLVQVLLIVLGWAAVTVVLRFHGFPDNPTVRWNPLSVWLREWGWLFLVLVVLWTIYAAAATTTGSRLLSPGIAALCGGLILALALSLFGYAAVAPVTHPLLVSRQPVRASEQARQTNQPPGTAGGSAAAPGAGH